MAEKMTDDNIIYLQARPQDIESLTTLVARAFHPINHFMERMFPDTPLMRNWWRQVFAEYTDGSNPACHLPIALDTTTNTVIGGLVFRMIEPNSYGGGFVGKYAPTPDHDPEIWPIAVEGFVEAQKKTVGDRGRFLIEVIGVDPKLQGRGIGRRLVETVCEIADQKGYPIYLNTAQARGFYLALGKGFEVAAVQEDPDDPDADGSMIREPDRSER